MKLDIFKFELAREKLDAMPVDERALLLLLGHACNEINVLQRLLIASAKGDPDDSFVDHVEAAQGIIILRLLVGKLHESWRLFDTRYRRNREVSQKYNPKLDGCAIEAIKSLNKHFSKSPLSRLRNEVIFHYPDNDGVDRAYRALVNEKFHFYLSEKTANTFYLASESVINFLMSMQENGVDGEIGLHAVFDAVVKVAKEITLLFGQLIALIGEEWLFGPLIEPTLLSVPKLAHLPFFVDPDSLK